MVSADMDALKVEFDLVSLLSSWADRSPDQVAVRSYDVAASKESGMPIMAGQISAAQLEEQAVAIGAALRNRGISPGEVIALQVPNWHQSFVTYLAVASIGAVAMPISTIYRGRDLVRQLSIGQATTLVVPARLGKRNYIPDATELINAGEPDSLQRLIAIGDSAFSGATSWDCLLKEGLDSSLENIRNEIRQGLFSPKADDLVLLNFTSGTTGEPKGVMHTPRSIFSSAQALIQRLALTHEDRFFVPTTLGHAAGFLNGLFVPLMLGATTIYMDSWDAGTALQVIENEKVTYGPVMPTYLMDILDHPDFQIRDISSWRRARVSGGAIPRKVISDLQQQLPHLRLCPGWGMSEVLYATCGSPEDPLSKLATSDGRPLQSASIRILDLNGEELPVGAVGEIVVKGPSVTLGYFGRDQLTQSSRTTDGWFKSGDLGFLDEEGFLTIAGRSKELVIRGGENVPVVEVEHLLNGHPRIRHAAIIGVPDRRLGEKVCAVIELSDNGTPLTLDDIRNFLDGEGLTKQFIPEEIEIVEELPRTSLGKIRKIQLKKDILALRNLDSQDWQVSGGIRTEEKK